MDFSAEGRGGNKELGFLLDLLEEGIEEGVFVGAAAGIVAGPPAERRQWIVHRGRAARLPATRPLRLATCFDLASLTKPLATTLAIMALVEEEKIGLAEPLPQLLREPIPADKQAITLRQLLSHCSGLTAHRPFYREIAALPEEKRRQAMLDRILADPLAAPIGSKAIYSDLGFMLLGWIAEERCGERLNTWVGEKIYRPLGLDKGLFFRPLAAPPPQGKEFASSEACPWRGRVLCGEVSDENTHALGGVAGQAGLFGDVASAIALVTFLLDCWQGRRTHPAFSMKTLRTFLSREGSVPESTWALGFDTPSSSHSSAGRFFSPRSVGHLGFTGTSFWIDPDRDLAVVLLTNRVHPSRDNLAIRGFRPRFHDAVAASLNLC